MSLSIPRRLLAAAMSVVLTVTLVPGLGESGQAQADDLVASALSTQSAKVNDRENATQLTLGETKYFDGGGSETFSEWYTFKTSSYLASYEISGNFDIGTFESHDFDVYKDNGDGSVSRVSRVYGQATLSLLPDTVYFIYAFGAARALCVTETPSTPFYPALGESVTDPCKLTAGETVYSQFHSVDKSGATVHWFTFTTGSTVKWGYQFAMTRLNDCGTIEYSVTDNDGKVLAGTSNTSNKVNTKEIVKTFSLEKNSRYWIKVYLPATLLHTYDHGYPSYSLSVRQRSLTKAKSFKVKNPSKYKKTKYVWKALREADGYEVKDRVMRKGYKWQSSKADDKNDNSIKYRIGSSFVLKAKYKVKVRGYYSAGDKRYYGPWVTKTFRVKKYR